MSRYAANTEVSSDRSRMEIERILKRWGASQFMYGWRDEAAVIGFRAANRQVRFILPLPDRSAREFTHTPTGKARAATSAEDVYEQSIKQRWRALALVIKAKLEAVESGIVSFEAEFSSFIVLPDGKTVGEHVLPRIQEAYESHEIPELIPDYTGQKAITQ